MRTERTIDAVETHTGGMPTRIVTGGLESALQPGRSVAEQRDAFAARFDDLRKLLVMEPRGHDDMFCAVLTEPERPDADVGAFFMNVGGCHEDACIHGTIGIVTALVETGRLSGETPIELETPAGAVVARPTVDDGRVTSVAVENVFSYVRATDVGVDAADHRVSVNLVYSGNVFALLDASAVGLDVTPANVPRLLEYGKAILAALGNTDITAAGVPSRVNAVSIYQSRPDVYRNLVVAPGGHFDRSPSGTGTAALMVARHRAGDLAVGESFGTESVVGSRFEGTIRRAERRDGRTGVVPEITGSAYLVAKQTFFVDPDDPIVGFSGLRDGSGTVERTSSGGS